MLKQATEKVMVRADKTRFGGGNRWWLL